MSAAAEEGERATAEGSAHCTAGGPIPSPRPPTQPTQRRGESARELILRLLLGCGSLVLLGMCVVALVPTEWWQPVDHFPNPRIEPELFGKRFSRLWLRWITGQFVLGFWLAMLTGLAWITCCQVRCSGVTPAESWFDLRQPLRPGMQRIPLSAPHSDWVWMLRQAMGLLLVGLGGLLLVEEVRELGLWLIPWLVILLWLGEGFVRILWRRVAETLVLTEDRLVWHLGPCQVQIPYLRLEEVLRGSAWISLGPERRELLLVTRGEITVVARPGLPVWLLFWLLPRRERVVQSGLTHECFRLRPANELVTLEAIAARAPHLAARGMGLLATRPQEERVDSTEELARNQRNLAIAQQSDRRVVLVPQPFRSVLVNLCVWLLFPLLTLELLQELKWIAWDRPYLSDWWGAYFILPLLAWFAFLGCLVWLWRKALPQCPGDDWPTQPAEGNVFRQSPGRWGWLVECGQLWRLVVLSLGLLVVGMLRMGLDLPELAMFEGLGWGLWLTFALHLLRQIWVARRGALWLFPDRLLGDCGWTQVALRYNALQEATLTAPLGSPGDAGELRLRGAVPFQIPARRTWWSLPRMPFLRNREIPAAWQDRAWLVTLAEPERFLRDLGPHVPHLIRGPTGWITPLPCTETTSPEAGGSPAQSTTNSTLRQ